MIVDRLDLQHYLWKDQTGYLLHPSIPLSSIQNVKIADVGTGTGYVRLSPSSFLLEKKKLSKLAIRKFRYSASHKGCPFPLLFVECNTNPLV